MRGRVDWSCRIHRLHLCRGVRPPPTSVQDMTLNNLIVRFQWCWGFGEWQYPLFPLLFGPLWPGMVAPDRTLFMSQIKLECIRMLNWIVWIRTVWLNWIVWNRDVFHNHTVYLHLDRVLMLNWIVWNGTVFDFETVLTLNWIV